MEKKTIAVAGTGYVGLANAVLLSLNNKVYAVDIIKEKVDLINKRKSPIQDKEIEEYLSLRPHLMLRLLMLQPITFSLPLLQTMTAGRTISIQAMWKRSSTSFSG